MNDAPSIDPVLFRHALGHFASGVTVVTVETDGRVHGMTANAFCSVSLDPPLVLVAVDQRARMHGLLACAERFGISILGEHQRALSQHFAGRPEEGAKVEFVRHEQTPLLAGAVAHLACRLHGVHPAGDHSLYLGRVHYVDYRGGMRPLMFYGGQYRELDVQIRDPEFWWV